MNRIQLEISLGILFVLATTAILFIWGLNEEKRMEEYAISQTGQAIEVGAELYDSNCRSCHGAQGEGVLGLCPPLNDSYFFTSRMKDVGWSGSIEDYIVATVSSGRLTSTRPEQYPGNLRPAMPAWSDAYGGPLRADQIRSIATFIMNWESTAPDRTPPQLAGPAIGTDITQELPEANIANGEALASAQGCVGCHIATNTGPAWLATNSAPGIGTRAETRFQEAGYTGNAATASQYMLEAIVRPADYIVPGYETVAMPGTYGTLLTVQDAADLVAYLLSLK